MVRVVAAVNGGLLTIDEVLERYSLTLEEFASWQRAMDRSGMQGLRGTRIQKDGEEYGGKLRYWFSRRATAREERLPKTAKHLTEVLSFPVFR